MDHLLESNYKMVECLHNIGGQVGKWISISLIALGTVTFSEWIALAGFFLALFAWAGRLYIDWFWKRKHYELEKMKHDKDKSN